MGADLLHLIVLQRLDGWIVASWMFDRANNLPSFAISVSCITKPITHSPIMAV